MSQENKINEVLNTVNDIVDIMHFMRDNMATKDDLKKGMNGVRKEIDGVRKEVGGVRAEMATNIEGIRSVMATKKDLERFATKKDLDVVRSSMATREDFFYLKEEIAGIKREAAATKSEIIGHIDGFVGMHKGLDLELVSLRSKYQRLESHVHQLAKHTSLTLE